VVVYHAMIGDIPFQGETLGALCVSITRGAHTPPSRVRAGVPASVDAWMARALALDPSRRFQSAKELAVTFRSALHGVTAWASAEELSTVRTVIAGEDSLPTVQLPTPLRGTGASGTHGTVVMATTGEQPRQPASVAAPIAEPSTVMLEDESTRRRDRATRAVRRRWLLAITVAALGFLTGFAIVLLARPREDEETVPVTIPPPVSEASDTNATAPSAEVPIVSSETPPAASSATPAEPRVRPRPRPPTPSPSQPHVTPPAPPPPPRPVSKDRGF
jgi:serine/threonine-protein kinase